MSIADDMAEFFDDPHGFVLYSFDWGVGILKGLDGPDVWQGDALCRIGDAMKSGKDVGSAIKMAVSSGHGVGKGSRLTEPFKRVIICNERAVAMEDIKFGDLKIGDYVFGSDGKPTKIIGTNPYRRGHYKVTFDDGSSTVVSGQHEWKVRGRQERRKKLDTWRVLETEEIIELGVMRPNGKVMSKQWEIPIQGVAQFSQIDVFNPYTVGTWLGDGCSIGGSITSAREEMWEKMCEYPSKDTLAYKKNGMMTKTPKGFANALKGYGMLPTKCDEKFIADIYKYNSEDVRRELVSGMLDSDGEVHASGSIGYSSSSKRLVDDLIWMIRSLGGKAQMQPAIKKTGYKDANGLFHPCKDCYRCTINFGGLWNPFTHTYKKAKLKDNVEHRYLCRWITSIEPVGMHDGMCITVEAKDHLYLANDFIVTHNSALVAWIVLWFMSTRENPQVVVTANTQGQLKTKTWRELSKWHKLSINKSWFVWTATKFYMKDSPETWFASAIPWSETNSEAFAGTHDEHVLIIYDEASAIPDCIWVVTEGAMTTNGAMWVAFGNPTRNSGRFFNCFHDANNRWITMKVDSREAMMTNKTQINEWVEDYGEDSDFVRVRVRGVFPRAGSTQFISSDVASSGLSYVAEGYEGNPLVLGVDVARFGGDKTIMTFRQGRKVFKPHKYIGLDTMEVASKVADHISQRQPSAVFIDGGGIGGGVVDRLRQLGYNVIDVNMGGAAEDKVRYMNKRAEVWGRMRDFLVEGGDLPDDIDLQSGLTGPEFAYDPTNRLVIESKRDMRRRGLGSPDEADSLGFTFAEKVYSYAKRKRVRRVSSWLTV